MTFVGIGVTGIDPTGGTIGGMSTKRTIYLPEDLKATIAAEARLRGVTEAEVIRSTLEAGLARPVARGAVFEGDPIAERTDELLEGFGER